MNQRNIMHEIIAGITYIKGRSRSTYKEDKKDNNLPTRQFKLRTFRMICANAYHHFLGLLFPYSPGCDSNFLIFNPIRITA